MGKYEDMSLHEVIVEAIEFVNDDLERAGYDVHYPEYAVVALQRVMHQADDIASGDHLAGFAFASAVMLAIGEGLRSDWPTGLENRLRGRLGA